MADHEDSEKSKEHYEFFDPRQVHSGEERLMPVPEAPDLTPQEPPRIADDHRPVRLGKDQSVRYHRLDDYRTPQPEAWLAIVGGVLMATSVALSWTYYRPTNHRVGLSGYSIPHYGDLLLAAGTIAVVLGVVALASRRRRTVAFCWPCGLAAAVTVGRLLPQIARGRYTYVSGGQAWPVSGVGLPAVVLMIVGTLIVFLAALWASRAAVGR